MKAELGESFLNVPSEAWQQREEVKQTVTIMAAVRLQQMIFDLNSISFVKSFSIFSSPNCIFKQILF